MKPLNVAPGLVTGENDWRILLDSAVSLVLRDGLRSRARPAATGITPGLDVLLQVRREAPRDPMSVPRIGLHDFPAAPLDP